MYPANMLFYVRSKLGGTVFPEINWISSSENGRRPTKPGLGAHAQKHMIRCWSPAVICRLSDGGATTPERRSAPLSRTVIRRSSRLPSVDTLLLEDNRMCVKDAGLERFHSVKAKIKLFAHKRGEK